jgi:CRISPR-associated protein Cas2
MFRHYLVTYDISDPCRLRQVHAIVRDFGQPVQYSVFLARLSDSHKAELMRRLARAIHHEHDQVLLFDLGRAHGQHEIELPAHEVVGRSLGYDTRRVVIV